MIIGPTMEDVLLTVQLSKTKTIRVYLVFQVCLHEVLQDQKV